MTQWKNYLKIKEAADFLGVSELTLRNWDNNGKLPAERHPINKYRFYRITDLENFMKVSGKKKPNDIKAKLEE